MASRRQQRRGGRRWIAWTVGLLALGGALWALAGAGARGGPPLDDIDPASEARLEELLRDAGADER